MWDLLIKGRKTIIRELNHGGEVCFWRDVNQTLGCDIKTRMCFKGRKYIIRELNHGGKVCFWRDVKQTLGRLWYLNAWSENKARAWRRMEILLNTSDWHFFPTLQTQHIHLATSFFLHTTRFQFHFSAANLCNSSNPTLSNALSPVASKCTFGTTSLLSFDPSGNPFEYSNASLHLPAQRHHLQPPVNPIERRLFPREAEKSRNWSVSVAFCFC